MAHALRHSYGMELASRSVPLPVIQQLLGTLTHVPPASTPPPMPATSLRRCETPVCCSDASGAIPNLVAGVWHTGCRSRLG